MPSLPKLPAKAAYIYLNNASKRNALSLNVLRDLRAQLHQHLTSPETSRLLILPPFQPCLLDTIAEPNKGHYRWLVDVSEWQRQRKGLPDVLVLRSEGPVFSSGHDLKELAAMTHDERKATFDTCAEVMSLLRRSPAVVVCPVQGLATAAGFQLAMSCDIPIAQASTKFQLPGMSIGLPCTSPSTAVSRHLPLGMAYRMFATAEPIRADQLGGAVDVVGGDSTEAFETRVKDVICKLVEMPGQPQALGKWAYWAQASVGGGGTGGDGFEEAASWAAGAMTLHARSEDAKRGMSSFLNRTKARWNT